ncbi:MAG TPA: HlyD family efflux transporter periplasmic adaptor subunit [Terriglobales bacterium]|nr:HlyD family efflux transporter periplasmic adaptor subunit [Terriglobales bacterium]
MNARNRVFMILGIIIVISAIYYFVSTPRSKDTVLIGTVDANQIIVSPQIEGRLAKLLVDEGTQVKQGDLIAVLDPSELEAEAHAAAATIDSLRSQVAASMATSQATSGSTTSSVAGSEAKLASSRAQLLQAEAMLQQVESDSRRTIELAKSGVASDQQKVQAETNLQAQQATVEALKQQVSASQADLNTALANTHQAHAAQSTVASTRAQLANTEAALKEAEVRLGYTKIYAPVTGTVSVRAAREGEVLNAGQPIVTIVDFSDTWVRAAIPETESDHIGMGDTLRVRLPGGTETSGKVFFKSPEADFATQRDVSRRKRDIRTIVLKVRLANPKGDYVPGMTADVLVTPEQLAGTASTQKVSQERQP